jgi:hypothetical protein
VIARVDVGERAPREGQRRAEDQERPTRGKPASAIVAKPNSIRPTVKYGGPSTLYAESRIHPAALGIVLRTGDTPSVGGARTLWASAVSMKTMVTMSVVPKTPTAVPSSPRTPLRPPAHHRV